MPAAALIGVDWGTSSFRAFLLAASGAVLDQRFSPKGILTGEAGTFADVLASEIDGWLAPGRPLPVLMSGMIGSRQGWLEAPYVTTPASLTDLAAGLVDVPFEGASARLVPGIATAGETMRDVMRGEEMQVFGALEQLGVAEGRFLLPGTHSKWVHVEEGRVGSFRTYMTGEIYAATRQHTILGKLMEDGESPAAFLRGVREGAHAGTPGSLLNRFFGVRTAGLFGDLSGRELPDYLSGLLIGSEIADGLQQDSRPVHIIATTALADRYATAAQALGLLAERIDPACIARAYIAVTRAAGLVAEA
jgi:2-dehydro-3-deoxygalactonokinase